MVPRQLADDLRGLLETAFAPIEVHQQTFLDRLMNGDTGTKQLEQKFNACHYANVLVKQRTDLFENLKKMVLTCGDLQNVQLAAQAQILQGRIGLQQLGTQALKLEAERLKLEEEIAQQQALKARRIETLQLEENNRQARLLAQLEPPAPEPTKKSQMKEAIKDHREQIRAKATSKQLVLSDFLQELQKVFRANVEDSEKAARIRAVMEAYRQEAEALPRDIRDFLGHVEEEEAGHD